ncbi:hypothetical protein OPV22_031922 [Ensete ventricosum]|uniref:Uncharacterized protein n=1 Tax=Ensete ventricosum TaxID=4639 RepID=A0AAV8NZM5_ENSVE|nr:hypothetical protein OPV22_031922 [Ensete ventricosum]
MNLQYGQRMGHLPPDFCCIATAEKLSHLNLLIALSAASSYPSFPLCVGLLEINISQVLTFAKVAIVHFLSSNNIEWHPSWKPSSTPSAVDCRCFAEAIAGVASTVRFVEV